MLNEDYKVIGFTLISTLYFIISCGNIFYTPIFSIVIFSLSKLIIRYFNILQHIKYSQEEKIPYEIIEKYDNFIFSIGILTFIASIFNLYQLQFLITVLLLIDKYTEYCNTHIEIENYYINHYNLTRTVLLSSLLLVIHFNQIENQEYLLNIITFLCHNVLVSISYETKLNS